MSASASYTCKRILYSINQLVIFRLTSTAVINILQKINRDWKYLNRYFKWDIEKKNHAYIMAEDTKYLGNKLKRKAFSVKCIYLYLIINVTSPFNEKVPKFTEHN